MKIKELKQILDNLNDEEVIHVRMESISQRPSLDYNIKKVDTVNSNSKYYHYIVI